MTQKLDDVHVAEAEQRALDCWTHGIAHLVEVLGHRRSTALMTHLTAYLIDRVRANEAPKESTGIPAPRRRCRSQPGAAPRAKVIENRGSVSTLCLAVVRSLR